MGIRTVLLSFGFFCLCMFALAAEVWIYVLTGMGAGKTMSVGAVLFVGLMVLTGALGVLVPVSSMVWALVKKPAGTSYVILLPVPPFVFTGKRK